MVINFYGARQLFVFNENKSFRTEFDGCGLLNPKYHSHAGNCIRQFGPIPFHRDTSKLQSGTLLHFLAAAEAWSCRIVLLCNPLRTLLLFRLGSSLHARTSRKRRGGERQSLSSMPFNAYCFYSLLLRKQLLERHDTVQI
ncbi:unnamed protein product [Chondrus crispus]|uniref:Uncharacterized protein n=1 Tax=Chondrus crispus TaxID=2769 RepID=R7QPM2_CHOCR|nr:unnamed protein product [Chondrus crispus]CDF40029.1 unnamed protein product [Chondrus crispus]|eukprot:XP_005710323.1 unnamed protein product [Chondrus crispus]